MKLEFIRKNSWLLYREKVSILTFRFASRPFQYDVFCG